MQAADAFFSLIEVTRRSHFTVREFQLINHGSMLSLLEVCRLAGGDPPCPGPLAALAALGLGRLRR